MSSVGSVKMEKNCTCTIKVTFEGDGNIKTHARHTHYGHTKDLGYTWLTKKKRMEIAQKLQMGVSKEQILDDIRDSVGEKFSRIHLIDGKDLGNISKSCGLDNVERHSNYQTSVLTWLEELGESEKNPILYHKLQGA